MRQTLWFITVIGIIPRIRVIPDPDPESFIPHTS